MPQRDSPGDPGHDEVSLDRTEDPESPVRVLHYADLENVYDHPDRLGRLAGALRARRDERTLLVGAGDDTALGTLALLTDEGRAQARPFFEALAPDADTFGNHDLDFGDEWALSWAESVPTTYCCANLDGSGADRVPDTTTVACGGATVGVVGLCHPEKITGAASELTHTDAPTAAAEAAAELRQAGSDYVVVASHAGTHDPAVARAADADVVLGGHVHERRTEWIDGTLLVRTAGNGTEFSEVRLGGEPSVRYHAVAPDADDSGVEHGDSGVEHGDSGIEHGDGPFDADLAAEYRRRREAIGVDEVVATVPEPLPRTEVERFRGESRLGNFAADAFRAATGSEAGEPGGGAGGDEADLALFPAGSLRAGPPLSGDVTVDEVVSLCPFGGDVVELELPGEALLAAFERMATPQPERGWVHCHASGARAVWTDDDSLRTLRVGGDPVQADATYRVAAPEFCVAVDDFPHLPEERVVERHRSQYEALLSHARDGGLTVGLEGRISRVPAEEATPGRT